MPIEAKVTKIMVSPARTVNLGNFNSAKLSAGLEIEFSKPVDINSKEVKQAFKKANEITSQQFIEQYKPYKDYLVKRREVNTNG